MNCDTGSLSMSLCFNAGVHRKPFSSLWKVTNSMTAGDFPVTGLRSGIAVFYARIPFLMTARIPAVILPFFSLAIWASISSSVPCFSGGVAASV